jgi:SAM-dependent methyltransferase
MSDPILALAGRMACPDDHSSLHRTPEAFECEICDRTFPILRNTFVELLPTRAAEINSSVSSSYRQNYLSKFTSKFTWEPNALPFGAAEAASASWIRKRYRQVEHVLPLIANGENTSNLLLCDFSGGPGHHTLTYSANFMAVIHCDLSVDSIDYAKQKAESLSLNNLIFARMDYLSPPFHKSCDRIICFDTLIRGESHDRALLQAIHQSLRPDGFAVVDFHNWWHNPIRRLGLLPENFHNNRSYSKREADNLLRSAGIHSFEYFPFHQELAPEKGTSGLLAGILPPTRHIYRFSGIAANERVNVSPHTEQWDASTVR